MSDRADGGFSQRVWDEIDRTVASVKAANCTARRFLEVDGPYGMGFTSVAGAEVRLAPAPQGAVGGLAGWNVPQAPAQPNMAPPFLGAAPPLIQGAGTYVAGGQARPVPVIASQFTLGIRAIAAYDAGCQPLDLCPAVAAARDVSLEEERLIYYGSPGDPAPQALLQVDPVLNNFTDLNAPRTDIFDVLRSAVDQLAARGYAGPFALIVEPDIYRRLYGPVLFMAGNPVNSPMALVELVRSLFRGGIYMAPVINSGNDPVVLANPNNSFRVGAVVTLGRAYSRLVVGQDWYTAYRGRDGVLHNFVLMSSVQYQICDPGSIQVLRHPAAAGAPPLPFLPPFAPAPITIESGL